jgi:hypothetical protein
VARSIRHRRPTLTQVRCFPRVELQGDEGQVSPHRAEPGKALRRKPQLLKGETERCGARTRHFIPRLSVSRSGDVPWNASFLMNSRWTRRADRIYPKGLGRRYPFFLDVYFDEDGTRLLRTTARAAPRQLRGRSLRSLRPEGLQLLRPLGRLAGILWSPETPIS